MKLTLGFSPCPNDTFIFDALVNGKINTGDLQFEPVLEDVETLNRWALEGKLNITKLSFPAFFQSLDQYVLLHSGSALGKGVGPLLIAKTPFTDSHQPDFTETISQSSIAIPGIHTTANLLLGFAFPHAKSKLPFLFSEIEDVVLDERVKLGVIIHENRFTYWKKGLHKILDLGEFWEQKMNAPIPLGGIAIQRKLDPAISLTVDLLIKKSLEYAFAHYPLLPDYVRQHSQAMEEEVMRQHIDLYVNDYSLDLGEVGWSAILSLRDCYANMQGMHIKESPSLFL